MPDLRAHGLSARPHEPEHYPVGILARDLRELVAHLGLTDFDLGGFSLGARTTVEESGEGLKPRRAVLGGAGLDGLKHWERRKNFFLEAIELFDRVPRGDPHWLSIQFMKSQKIDRVSAALLLQSFADAFLDWLKAFTMPTLVVCGSEDDDNGSAEELAAMLPNAVFEQVPGTHMSSVTKPEFGEAIACFSSSVEAGRPKAPLVGIRRSCADDLTRLRPLAAPVDSTSARACAEAGIAAAGFARSRGWLPVLG